LKDEIKKQKDISELNLVETVGTKKIKKIGRKGKVKIALIDCGVKKSIIENLLSRKAEVILFPYKTKAEKILSFKPDGVLVSNGPGDPEKLKETIAQVRKLIGKLPLFGICLGHQIIALAAGAKTFKLKFGHRGLNQPVKDVKTGRVFITVQNHGFAVLPESLKGTGLKISKINLNDMTIEGLEDKRRMIKTVQYHPEASPGPRDTNSFFDKIIKELYAKKKRP